MEFKLSDGPTESARLQFMQTSKVKREVMIVFIVVLLKVLNILFDVFKCIFYSC